VAEVLGCGDNGRHPYASGIRNWILYGSTDDSTYTQITTGICVAGASENEFLFPENETTYTYFKLLAVDSYSGAQIAVASFSLFAATPPVAETNFYLFTQEEHDIVRRVIFPDYASMLDFVTSWEADNPNWDAGALAVHQADINTTTHVLTIATHGFHVGDSLKYLKVGAQTATPLVDGTTYYVREVLGANTFTLTGTPGGDLIHITNAGNDSQTFTPNMYFLKAVTFDIDDTTSIAAEMVAADDFAHAEVPIVITDTLLDSKIWEALAVGVLTVLFTADTLFGTPSAYAISLASTGQTSFHELKRRTLSQELVAGVWTDIVPYQYVQTKHTLVTAEGNLLLCNVDDNDHITGYIIIGSGLKSGTEWCWANFQNRAFGVNGAESDCNAIWTDGAATYLNGMVAPVMISDVVAHTVATSAVNITDDEITIAAHGYRTNQRITYANGGGASITGLTTATVYYVIAHDANTIKLSLTADGAALDLSGTGNNAQTITGTPITQAVTGGYMSDGAYSLKLRYHRSTYGTNDSNPSDAIAITLAGGGAVQKITLDVVFSSDPQVSEVHVYRTKLLDALYYKAKEHANSYSATDPTKVHQIDVTLADNAIGTQALETDNDPAPKSKFITTLGMINRMGYVTDEGAYFSKAGFPEQVPLENFIPIGTDDGELITGSIVCNGWWIIGKETQIFAIDLNNITQLKAVRISGTIGVLDGKTMVEIEDGQAVMFVSQLGISITDGVSVTNLSRGKTMQDEEGSVGVGSRNMDDFVNNFNYSLKNTASAVFYPKKQLYICCAPYKGTDDLGRQNYRIWVYDVVRGSFYKWKFPIKPVRLFTMTDHGDVKRLISSFTQLSVGEYYGYFMVHDDDADHKDTVSITFAGVETRENIIADLITSWFNLGVPERNKSFRMLYADIYASAAATITISVGINHRKTFTPDVSTLVHAGETGTAPTEGRDEIEGIDFGRSRIIATPVDAVGEEFAIRFQVSSDAKVRLNGLTAMFRVRGARP
jgi:hypothetical protein